MSATKAVSTTANVESPLKNVEEFAVPEPNLAVGIVPVKLDAATEPLNDDAVMIPYALI